MLITDMDFHIDELKEQLAERDAEIASLRRRIKLQDATINRQAAQLIELQEQLTDERMMVAQLRANVVQLRTALDAVPLQEIFRCTTNDDYMPEQYDADCAAIDAWLRRELSADE